MTHQRPHLLRILTMLPSFLKFIEEVEETSGVSSPQHEVGEESLPLNKVVEKRIKEIINEFQTKGKATEKEIIASLDYNVKKMLGSQDPNSQQPQETPPNSQDQQQQQPQMSQQQQPQMSQQQQPQMQ